MSFARPRINRTIPRNELRFVFMRTKQLWHECCNSGSVLYGLECFTFIIPSLERVGWLAKAAVLYVFVSVPLWRPWTSCQRTLGRIFVGCPLFRGPPQCYRSSPIIDTGSQHASLGSQHASLGSPRAKKCFLSVQNYRFQQLWFTSVVAFLFEASSAGFWGLLSHFILPDITSLADPGIYYAQ